MEEVSYLVMVEILEYLSSKSDTFFIGMVLVDLRESQNILENHSHLL